MIVSLLSQILKNPAKKRPILQKTVFAADEKEEAMFFSIFL